jgi:hypothetical protein
MAVLRLSMAQDRRRRFRFALTFAAWSVPCLLSGCVTYHSAGQPYSGTAFWLENAAKPWHCYDTAPSKTLAFAVGAPYTAVVVSLAATTAISETLILPVDHYFGGPDLPMPAQGSCNTFWGKHESPMAPPSGQPPYPETPPVEALPPLEPPSPSL